MRKKKPKKKIETAVLPVPKGTTTSQQLIASLNTKFKDKAALTMDKEPSGVREVFPSGLEVLDRYLVGIGGIPWGRLIEISGKESGGKTTLACKLMAGAQKDGALAVLMDAEQTFESSWAQAHGVNLAELVWIRPPFLFLDGPEGALARIEAMVDKLLGSKQKAFIVIDSTSALKTQIEMDQGLNSKEGMAEAARYWSRGLRVLTEKIHHAQCTICLLSQTRANIGGYGSSTSTAGGNAIKFYASLRFKMWSYKPDNPMQDWVQLGIEVIKNKVSRPFRKADLRLHYYNGFDERWNILNHAKDVKAVPDKSQSYKEAVKALGWFDLVQGATDEAVSQEAPAATADPAVNE